MLPGVVKLRRGLTARVFDQCDGMHDLNSWFVTFLQQLQEKALMQVDKTDPTREVSGSDAAVQGGFWVGRLRSSTSTTVCMGGIHCLCCCMLLAAPQGV